jgi:dihydropteroate synthase
MAVSGLPDSLPRAALMGVVNVTPDSFSDGGLFLDAGAAVEHGLRLVEEGAHLLDVGGESTRPGAEPVSADEELARVLPVVERLAAESGVPVSIDTTKAAVAERALAAGATMVNDVTALRFDPDMAGVVAAADAALCLMHMQGTPRTMQDDPRYDDVVAEIVEFLGERVAVATGAGVSEQRICVDPGIGFGKTVAHNLRLIRELDAFCVLGRPIVVGVSRKRFLGSLTGRDETERVAATVAANVAAFERGGRIFRVHDVAPNRDALTIAEAIEGAA